MYYHNAAPTEARTILYDTKESYEKQKKQLREKPQWDSGYIVKGGGGVLNSQIWQFLKCFIGFSRWVYEASQWYLLEYWDINYILAAAQVSLPCLNDLIVSYILTC